MPRIISKQGKWKSVAITGAFNSDENLSYLCSFEELDANNTHLEDSSLKFIKKARKRKRKTSLNDGETIDAMELSVDEEPSLKVAKDGLKRKKRKINPRKGQVAAGNNAKKLRKTSKKMDKIPSSEETVETVEQTSSMNSSENFDIHEWNDLSLPKEVEKAILDMRFKSPTEIQKAVIPVAIKHNCDIVGAAETGSGKTLAFAIPIVHRLLELEKNDSVGELRFLRALILAPTRELVVQIKHHFDALLSHVNFKALMVIGGLSEQKQQRLLKYRPEIVIGTPGRLWAHLNAASDGDYLSNLSQLSCFVIDEADRMVEKGHFDELQSIINLIKRQSKSERQSFVFSATLTFVHPPPRRLSASQTHQLTVKEKIKQIAEVVGLRKERKIFDLTRSLGTAEALVETKISCANLMEKDTTLLYLLTRYTGRTLIFTNSIDASRRIYRLLSKIGGKRPSLLHSKMIQKQRLKSLENFKNSAESVLVATDVASRGLDIQGIEHVVHYQVPKTAELYVHRSGRTARATHQGLAVLLVDPSDVQYYRRICRNLNREKDLSVFPIDSPELFKALKKRVSLASELESVEHRIRKIHQRENWFEKMAREADILYEEKKEDESSSDLAELRAKRKVLESQFKRLSNEQLPRFDRVEFTRTRYVNAGIVAEYDKPKEECAITCVEKSIRKEKNEKSSRKIRNSLIRNQKNWRKCKRKPKRK